MQIMKTIQKALPSIASLFFILLFIYAASSKIRNFAIFQVQLAQSPILSTYAGVISYGVIALEIGITILLFIPKRRNIGLYSTFGLMVAFTVYIYLILNHSDFVPCSCGGILEKMGWEEHLIFNIGCTVLALTAGYISDEKRSDKGQAKLSAGVFVISSASMLILFLSSEYIIKKENNFTRRFPPHPIDFPQKLDLEVNSFYFAGQQGDTLFLGNKTAPLVMGKIYPSFDKLLLDTLKLNFTSLPFRELKLQVQYPFYSLSDGHVPAVFEGKFPSLKAQLVMYQKAYFSNIVMIRPQHYIFRTQNTQTKETIMGLLETKHYAKIRFSTTFLEKQIDGVFDTDGNFITDPLKQNVIYTYFYRNEYRILDDSLRFAGMGKTIDTISKAQLKLTTMEDGRTKMMAPPLKVNQNQVAYDGFLFNEANLRGRHEPIKMWQQAKVIDVYHYPTSTYRYSFYVYHDRKNKMRSMLLTAKYFYVLSGNQLIRYRRMR